MIVQSTRTDCVQFQFPAGNGGQMLLRIAALSCGAVRVTRTLREAFCGQSGDVVTGVRPGACRLLKEGDAPVVACGGVNVRVNPESGALSFLSQDGQTLLREDEKRPCVMEEKPVMIHRFRQDAEVACAQGVDGVRSSCEDFEIEQARTAYAYRLSFAFDESEGLYGLGSHEEGYGNLRGRSRALYQHNLKAVVPVLLSTKGWGLLFDLGCLSAFHDDAHGSYLWADCADEMDYYFLSGGYDAVCRQYAALTGAAPLLPRYAFGFIQSKERYKDAQELLSVVREYRRRQVPLDVIVQDWQTWPDGQWGYKVFDETRYPDPKGLTDALHAMGAKMMLSIWPSMSGEANRDREEMLQSGCMLGNGTIYNAFDEKARRLYWKQTREGLFRHGVDAWWCDCSEPFESDWHGAVKPEPFERVRLNTEEAKKYLDPGRISLYSLYHAMGVYQGQRGETSEKRVFNLTRSSWAGQHRYAAATWSGDVSATWETLRRQVPEGLNFMSSGEAYWSTDAGGFFPADCNGAWFGAGDFPRGVDDPGYRELFVRWMQLGAFLPLMRAHGMGTPREIWRFGEKGGKWYDALEKIIRLRSRLVPHLYSLAARYAFEGRPLVCFPALAFAQDARLRQIDDEMLLGDAVLVRPVTHPMEYLPGGKKLAETDDTVSVYLPAGTSWYRWDAGDAIHGGQTVRVHAPLDAVPLFVRAGGIVLLGPVRQHVDESPDAPLTVAIYPGADGSFVWYSDAGDGYGYEAGQYALTTFTWREASRELHISERKGRFPGMPEKTWFLLRLAGEEKASVLYEGKEMSVGL